MTYCGVDHIALTYSTVNVENVCLTFWRLCVDSGIQPESKKRIEQKLGNSKDDEIQHDVHNFASKYEIKI